MSDTVDKLLWTLFRVRPPEKRRTILMAVYLLAAVSAFIMGRIIRDSLFLSHFDKSALAYNYVTVAVAVSLPAYLYTRIADRYRRDRIILFTLSFLFLSLVAARLLVETRAGWFYFAFYNWIEVLGAFLMIQFWTFASDVFSSREAKRLFPFIILVGVLANPLCGLIVRGLVPHFGTANLIIVQAALLLVCIAAVSVVAREQRDRLIESLASRRGSGGQTRVSDSITDDVRAVFKSKHLQVVAAITAITFVSTQFVDFAFKSITRETYQGDALSQFYGSFYFVTGLLAAAVQFFVTRRLLERFGVVVALVILPLALFGGAGVAVVTMATLWAATLAKGAENSLRYSLYDATMQVLYTAVPSDIRGRAKALIDGILKPLAMGLAGGLLLLLNNKLHVPVTWLYAVALASIAVWVGLVLGIKREYVRQLMDTLRKRRLNFEGGAFEISDARTIEVLEATLASQDPREVLSALELVPRVKGEALMPRVAELSTHPDPAIRKIAVHLLGSGEAVSIAIVNRVHRRFGDEDPEVRAEAVRTFCALARERAIPTVRSYLDDPSPAVRAAAVAGLMRHGGLDGILSSADAFKSMLHHAVPEVRSQAAWILGEIQVRNFFQPVLELMQDNDSDVQIAAIQAAGRMCSPELMPVLIYKLAQRETARAAQAALVAYGVEALPILSKVLAHDLEDIVIRRQIPRVLAAIPDRRCLEVLLNNLGCRDASLRLEIARAAARLRDRLGETADFGDRVRPHLRREVQDYYQSLTALDDIGGLDTPAGVDLLIDAIRERMERNLDRIFRVLGILYPMRTIDLVHRNLSSVSRVVRSNAVELLDNLLEKDVSRLVLPILDEASARQKIAFGLDAFGLKRQQREAWLGDFLRSDDAWLRVCALYDIGETGLDRFIPEVEASLHDPDPIIRETAVRALSVLVTPARFCDICEGTLDDRDPSVHRYANYMLSTAGYKAPRVEHARPASGPPAT